MKRGTILENIRIEKLVFGGKGFVRLEDNKVCFITGGAIPAALVDIKITKKRRDYYEAQIVKVVEKSALETGKHEDFPGAPWINIEYSEQLKIKQSQVEEALFHCKKYQEEIPFLPIVGMKNTFGYRNKIEFSFGKYISHKEEVFEEFNIGFHKRGEFSKVLDFEECLLIDEEQNAIYQRVREFARASGYPVYDQKFNKGFWRHFMMRGMHFSGQILLVFSVNPAYFIDPLCPSDTSPSHQGEEQLNKAIENIKKFVQGLVKDFPNIASVYISHNTNKADICIGDMELVSGKEYIEEKLLGYSFDIGPKSFFQTNSVGAEVLYTLVKEFYSQKGKEEKIGTILDLYAGTGTIGMIFSDIAAKVVSVELVEEASKSGKVNADKNAVSNMEFVNAKVEDFLEEYLNNLSQFSPTRRDEAAADLLIIDPPRAGMHPSALPNILKFGTEQIIYVSCNPATLARDLEYILEHSDYRIEKVQAVDMFPHTHHIETVVSLVKKES